jgi:hypothetical protein
MVVNWDGVSTVPYPIASIYPNPANNILHIDKLLTPCTYILTDIIGSIKLHGTFHTGNNTLSLTALPQGMYILELVGDVSASPIRVKVVKE